MSDTTVKATDHAAIATGKSGRVSILKDTSFVGKGMAASGFQCVGQSSAGKFTRGKANDGRKLSIEKYMKLKASEKSYS